MYDWDTSWDSMANHDIGLKRGYGKDRIVQILKTVNKWAGDEGAVQALENESAEIKITKGLHQKSQPHIQFEYLGALWHADVDLDTERVIRVSQTRAG